MLLLKMFHLSPSPHVLMGKDGWFFYTGEGVVQDYFGQQGEEPASLEKMAFSLLDRRDWLADRGIAYLFVPVPNKIMVYDAFLPVRVRQRKGDSFYRRFFDFLHDRAGFDNFVDLHALFGTVANSSQLYFKTDTHWTSEGSLFAFNAIVNHCRHWFPEFERVSELELRRTRIPYSGDLANLLHQKNRVWEQVDQLEIKETCAGLKEQRLSSKDHPGLKGAGHNILPVRNGCPSREKTVLVIHDSFGYSIKRYFNERFKDVVYSHVMKIGDLQGLIEEIHPDLVVELWVARNFQRTLTVENTFEGPMLEKSGFRKNRPVARFDGTAAGLVRLQHEMDITPQGGTLRIQATGEDPYFEVPFSPGEEKKRYLVEVELEAPQRTAFTLFFTTGEDQTHLQPYNSIRKTLKKGANRLLFRLPHPDVRGLLRIDPGEIPGDYTLHSLTLWEDMDYPLREKRLATQGAMRNFGRTITNKDQ